MLFIVFPSLIVSCNPAKLSQSVPVILLLSVH
nr:MAG TPA: hypothetical protein [Caudoviricetes sp.]